MDDWTARERAMPAVARVAADAVTRHEHEYHLRQALRLQDAELLAEHWVRSDDETTRRLGTDLLGVLRGH